MHPTEILPINLLKKVETFCVLLIFENNLFCSKFVFIKRYNFTNKTKKYFDEVKFVLIIL